MCLTRSAVLSADYCATVLRNKEISFETSAIRNETAKYAVFLFSVLTNRKNFHSAELAQKRNNRLYHSE